MVDWCTLRLVHAGGQISVAEGARRARTGRRHFRLNGAVLGPIDEG